MTDLNLNEDYSIQEAIITLVRNKLNEEKIKLWLLPYTDQESSQDVGNYPDDLVNRFHVELGIQEETVRKAFEQLRRHALHKLAARRNSNPLTSPTGLVLVKLKFVGLTKKNSEHVLEIDVSSKGRDLKQKASQILSTETLSEEVDTSGIKLIHKGSLISDTDVLFQVQIKAGSTILVLNSEKTATMAVDALTTNLQQTKDDAELLSSIDSDDVDGGHYLQIADQQGRPIKIPAVERKALAVAMTLHERGRSAMKSKKYNDALPFFLEADREFSKCNSTILTSVDNYALLNLDIVWCYLCLGSVTDLPDAERRLSVCRDCFVKSYGPNMERLEAIKGGHAQESALIARLHLLQGICAFHQRRTTEAKNILKNVSSELESLKVDDEKLAEIISFGYSTAEARLALRNANGNIENAVYHILKRREEKKRIRLKERMEREENRKRHLLGKTINGDWVQPNLHQQLLTMGYNHNRARDALAQADNSISLAVQILQDQQELLAPVDDEQVAILLSMGFDQNKSEDALRAHNGVLAEAQEALVAGLALDPVIPSTSRVEQREKLRDAVDRLHDDIPEEEEEYLDLDMQEETEFLNEYLALLK